MIPQRIVAIGSSSFFGVGDSEGGGFIGRFKTWHESQDIRNQVYNLGIPGDTTTGMRHRFVSEISIRKPKLILLSSGLNDTRRIGNKDVPNTTSIEKFRQNIQDMIQQGRKLCDVVFVSVYPIDDTCTTPLRYWRKNYFYLMTDIVEYEKIVRQICEKRRVPYVDIFSGWMKEDYKQWLFEDGLHANAGGHQKIFELLRDFLKGIYSS